ncbi:MAG: DUF488 domain-containing protein [Chloroflexota bacterium]|nr:DUF488 domain-containing protein [Chloroflexota bacterium]
MSTGEDAKGLSEGVIYTIGYGARGLDELIATLRRYKVEYMVDVRSQPYSRHKPEYTKAALEQSIREAGLRYVFMGDALGGRPAAPEYYSGEKVDYVKLREAPFYKEGIARLRTAMDKGLTLALMCSEGKPHECHRSKLIGVTLEALGVEVRHIDEQGELKTQAEALEEITHGQLSFFEDNPGTSTSRKGYAKT